MSECKNCGHEICNEKVLIKQKWVWVHQDEEGDCSVGCFECGCEKPEPEKAGVQGNE